MKKFITNIFLFLFCTIIVYVCGIMVWGNFMPSDFKKNLNYRRGASGFTYTRLHEVGKYRNIDVLFLGSSHTYRGFDPRIFQLHGYSSFNIGTSSQTPLQTEILVQKYIDQLKPSLVVFEVYPYVFSSDGVESSVDLIANDDVNKNTFLMATKVNNVKTYNTLLYAYLKRLLEKEKPIQEKLFISSKNKSYVDYTSYIAGGFMEKRREQIGNNTTHYAINTSIENENEILPDIEIIQSKDGEWQPRKNQLQAFERILNFLKERNIRVILVQAPIKSKYYGMIKCNKEIDAYFSSKGEYYNFNELIKFDDETDFSDYDHLNQQGVQKMNEALITRAFKK